METQSYDVSRLFASNTGQDCGKYTCPKCSCPTGKNIGDSWYHEYQTHNDIADSEDHM